VKQFEAAGDPLRPNLYWFNEPVYTQALDFVEYLRPIAERYHTTVATIAIAWTLAWQGVTGAICGAHKPEQLDAFLEAWKLRLTEDDFDEIAVAIAKTHLCEGTCGDGPAKPVRQW
jgi:aryl-alcohol dehydrogenase-like predicted oxidoreductase